jgi:hypothetical protein
MTTVINTPASNNSDSFAGVVIGSLLVLALGALFFVYGLPMIRAKNTQAPSKIDVNLVVPKDMVPTPTPQQ